MVGRKGNVGVHIAHRLDGFCGSGRADRVGVSAAEIAASAELWSTRNAGPVKLIASLLGRELRSFRQSRLRYDRGERLLDELLLVSRGGNQNVFHILVAKEDVEDVKPDDETAAIAAWGSLRFLS